MKILVTGTEGYIGSRSAPWLTAAGHEVVGLDTGLLPRRMALHRSARTATRAAHALQGSAHGDGGGLRRFRCGGASRRTVERSARPEPPRSHVQDQSRGLGAHCQGGAPGRRQALRLRVIVQRLRRRRGGLRRRDLADQPADGVRAVQGPGRARRDADGKRGFLASCSCATRPHTARRRACASISC